MIKQYPATLTATHLVALVEDAQHHNTVAWEYNTKRNAEIIRLAHECGIKLEPLSIKDATMNDSGGLVIDVETFSYGASNEFAIVIPPCCLKDHTGDERRVAYDTYQAHLAELKRAAQEKRAEDDRRAMWKQLETEFNTKYPNNSGV